MTKKLTTVDINTRMADKGIYVIGEYKNSSTSVEVKCTFGHKWKTRVANIINRGDGCPYCFGHSSIKQRTSDELRKIFLERNIKIEIDSDGIVPVKSKAKFSCSYGHEWVTSINSMLQKKKTSGCKQCYKKNLPLTLDELQRRYQHLGYKISGPIKNSNTKITFTCSSGHVWLGNPANSRCSGCANYGFNNTKEAYGYVLVFKDFIKYGISNSIDSRLYRHKLRNPSHTVKIIQKFSTGAEAKEWEKYIAFNFGKKFATKLECPDGWTETTSLEKLDAIIESLKNY